MMARLAARCEAYISREGVVIIFLEVVGRTPKRKVDIEGAERDDVVSRSVFVRKACNFSVRAENRILTVSM